MRRCVSCRLDIAGDLEHCPLCDERLSGEATPSAFPPNRAKAAKERALVVLAMVAAAATIAALCLGEAAGFHVEAMLAACAVVAVNYLFIRNVILHSPAFLRSIVRYFLVILAGLGLWYAATGDGAVVAYAIPGVCLLALAFDTALVLTLRDAFVLDYAKYLIFHIALGLIPLALTVAGIVARPHLALASAAAAAALTVVLALLARRQLAAELRKLFSA